MKKLLIISPYFPPSNAADMQRIRMSLPFYKQNGWEVTVVSVKQKHSEIVKDEKLLLSIPDYIKQVEVDAFSKKITKYFGLGSIALRSLYFYKKQVNYLLLQHKYDLIFFSTTQFPVCILGAYWKKKFKVPYVIDMQDPWHSDYYQEKPKAERPKKYWFSYHLNKLLEPIAMKQVDGLMSVSSNYIEQLCFRYPRLQTIPTETITFGFSRLDALLLEKISQDFCNPFFEKEFIHIVYVGRAGADMAPAFNLLFKAFAMGLKNEPNDFKKLRFHFFGTSYANKGFGIQSVLPIAEKFGVSNFVSEQTDRVSFYESLFYLNKADALLIPGSDDPAYTASKTYPYLMAKKPLICIFKAQSDIYAFLQKSKGNLLVNLAEKNQISQLLINSLAKIIRKQWDIPSVDEYVMNEFSADKLTNRQCIFFDRAVTHHNKTANK